MYNSNSCTFLCLHSNNRKGNPDRAHQDWDQFKSSQQHRQIECQCSWEEVPGYPCHGGLFGLSAPECWPGCFAQSCSSHLLPRAGCRRGSRAAGHASLKQAAELLSWAAAEFALAQSQPRVTIGSLLRNSPAEAASHISQSEHLSCWLCSQDICVLISVFSHNVPLASLECWCCAGR